MRSSARGLKVLVLRIRQLVVLSLCINLEEHVQEPNDLREVHTSLLPIALRTGPPCSAPESRGIKKSGSCRVLSHVIANSFIIIT